MEKRGRVNQIVLLKNRRAVSTLSKGVRGIMHVAVVFIHHAAMLIVVVVTGGWSSSLINDRRRRCTSDRLRVCTRMWLATMLARLYR